MPAASTARVCGATRNWGLGPFPRAIKDPALAEGIGGCWLFEHHRRELHRELDANGLGLPLDGRQREALAGEGNDRITPGRGRRARATQCDCGGTQRGPIAQHMHLPVDVHQNEALAGEGNDRITPNRA